MGLNDTVSVIGIDVRVPGADDQTELLDLLGAGRVRRDAMPTARLRDALLATTPDDHHLGSYLDRIDRFDAARFRLAPRVAEAMDPHQRICLESAADAIEDATANGAPATKRIGVYASAAATQLAAYERLQRSVGVAPDPLAVLAPSLAARISHVLDLRGPAIVVDTACSSGLAALAQARSDLLAGTVDLAVVTSANLLVLPGERGTAVVDVVSASDRTAAFDRAADGASVGEGAVSVVLGRTDLVGDGYGTVRAVEIAQDGRTATMASPNPEAQTELVERAWSDGAEPIAIVAHGTGTAIGDAVELESLSRVPAFDAVAPGSVGLVTPKSNLGHLDAASGLLGLVVALGVAGTGVVPPAASFVAPRDDAGFADGPFYLPAEPDRREPGAVGVSAFGLTGTLAHAVVGPGALAPQRRRSPRAHGERRWFRSATNSFAGGTSVDLDGAWVYTVRLEPALVWELAEHVVEGRPMLVGASLFELVHLALVGSPFDGPAALLIDLVIAEPIAASSTVTVAVRVDDDGRGSIRFAEASGPFRTWATFRVGTDPRPVPPLSRHAEGADAVRLGLDASVGDGPAAVTVSDRWQVGRSLTWHPYRREGTLRARPNATDAATARRYAFYPAVMDAALNALNATLAPEQVLFPWSSGTVWIDRSGIADGEVTSIIRQTDRVESARGDLVLTLDIDVRDAEDRLLVAVRDHRVKNAVEQTPTTDAPAQRWHEIAPVPIDSGDGAGSGQRTHVIDVSGTGGPLADAAFGLADELLRIGRSGAADLVVVRAPGAFGVAAPRNPVQAALAATAYSIRTEVGLDVAVVDADETGFAELIAGAMPHGLLGVDPAGAVHALRAVPTSAPSAPQTAEGPDGTLPDGTLLVLGASDGIGKAWAEHVAATGRRVVRAARRAESAGAGEYRRADVTEAADLVALLAEFPDIDRVVSFAGVPAEGLHLHTAPADFAARMASKSVGAHNLLDVFGASADVVLVGSVAAYTGAVGQAEYAAANAYQDALAATAGGRSILLGGWADVGMSAGRSDGVFARVSTEQGIAELDRFIGSDRRSAAVFALLPGARAAGSVLGEGRAPAPSASVTVPTSPDVSVAQFASGAAIAGLVGDRARIEDALRRAWAETLGDTDFEIDRSFFDYGGDSVSAVRLGEALDASLPGVFDVTTLFSCPTIADQIDHALTRIGSTSSDDVVDVATIQELLRQGGA
jgi:3-oxoacyl-(acyl-carrier-protein) synthase